MPRKNYQTYNYSYEPIICPQCDEEVYQRVTLEIQCPLGWNDLTKKGLRSNQVSIIGASHAAAHWVCGCAIRAPSGPRDTRLGPSRRQIRPRLNKRKTTTGEHRAPKVLRDPIDAP